MTEKNVEETPVAMTPAMLRDIIAGVAAQLNPGITADTLKSILESTANTSATAMQKSLVKENQNYVEVSCFSHPNGEKLRRPTFFCYAKQSEDTLTTAEIEAFNAITRSCSAQEGRWTATVVKDGSTEKLHVFVPNKNLDDRMGLPSLLLILRELKDGKAAVDSEHMAERLAELEAQVASFKLMETAKAPQGRAAAR
jgi:hypothetical protein